MCFRKIIIFPLVLPYVTYDQIPCVYLYIMHLQITPPSRSYRINANARNSNAAAPVPNEEVSNAESQFTFWLRVKLTRTSSMLKFFQILVVDKW